MSNAVMVVYHFDVCESVCFNVYPTTDFFEVLFHNGQSKNLHSYDVLDVSNSLKPDSYETLDLHCNFSSTFFDTLR